MTLCFGWCFDDLFFTGPEPPNFSDSDSDSDSDGAEFVGPGHSTEVVEPSSSAPSDSFSQDPSSNPSSATPSNTQEEHNIKLQVTCASSDDVAKLADKESKESDK